MTGPKPYSPDNPFAPAPVSQAPSRRYSTDNPFAAPSSEPDFSDVSGGASTATGPATAGGGYGTLAKIGEKITHGLSGAIQHPMETSQRVMDATLFGLPRRAEALGAALGGRSYDEVRAEQEAERTRFAQENPETAKAADVGGSLLGGVGAASKVGGGLLRQALGNAVIAGGQTLGETGDTEQAKGSAALGGGLTLALGAAGKAVKSIFSPKTAAEEAGAILDDISKRARITRQPVEKYAETKAAERTAATKPLYDAARKDVVPITAEMRDVLRDPLFQQAHARAEQLAARKGIPFQPLYDADGQVLGDASIGTIQSMKRRINDILKEAKVGAAPVGPAGATQTLADEEVNAVRRMRRTLTEGAGKNSPAFAEAESKFAEKSAPISAARRGEKFLNKGSYPDAAAIEKEMARLTPEAQQGYRQGALTALERQASRQVETVTGYRRLLKNTDLQDRVTAILPASERQAFRDMVERQGIWDAIRRLQNAPFLNAVKPVTSTVQAGRILGKQSGLGSAGKVVESTARFGGAELARYLAEAMQP